MKLLVKKVTDKEIVLGINILTGLPSSPCRNIHFDLFLDGDFIGTASMFGFTLKTKFIHGSLTKGLFIPLSKYLNSHRSKLLDINFRKTFNLPEYIRYW